MTTKSTRWDFTDDFKREAVSLLRGSGRPLTQVAAELGLQPSVLRRWRGSTAEERLQDLVPGGRAGQRGPCCDNPLFVDALLWMARSGARWRNLLERFGDYQAVKRRYYRWIARGALGRFLALLTADADLEWLLIDSTIVRAHQHAAGARIAKDPMGRGTAEHW